MRWNICNLKRESKHKNLEGILHLPWQYSVTWIFLVTYFSIAYLWWHTVISAPPPPPDRWSTKHFSSCSSWGRSCRWASKLLAEVQVQILMNFCRRQVLPPFDQFILLSPLNLQVLTFCTRSWLTDPLAKMVFLWDFVFSLVLLMGTTYGWKIQSKQQVSM